MLKIKLSLFLSLFITTGCDQVHNKNYIITCKHPLGHIAKYEVASYEARHPYSPRAGLWRFKTINGLEVISTYCHLEIHKGELI
jgi:hypothetical protein